MWNLNLNVYEQINLFPKKLTKKNHIYSSYSSSLCCCEYEFIPKTPLLRFRPYMIIFLLLFFSV